MSFVLGGAASGKSDFAEFLIKSRNAQRKIYVATAQAFDDEMRQKIIEHRRKRGDGWLTREAPLNLAAALAEAEADDVVLLDSLTLWLGNHLVAGSDLETRVAEMLADLDRLPCPLVVVSDEVGQGIVPDNAMARQFRNAMGRMNRRLAERADLVVAVMAGLPTVLKGRLPEEGA
jgi:adenosylcobinamide kinase/adenosylcobinamide-phosphate guanylyltransferase